MKRAANDAWQIVFVLGDPAYYQQFGLRLTGR